MGEKMSYEAIEPVWWRSGPLGPDSAGRIYYEKELSFINSRSYGPGATMPRTKSRGTTIRSGRSGGRKGATSRLSWILWRRASCSRRR